MGEDLPSSFDLIVVGTGFSESIVAAAASRIGKSVLHIDSNEFYGGVWASFNLDSFQNYIERKSNENDNELVSNCDIRYTSQKWFIEDKEESIEDEWTRKKIINEFRKFNIDLTPKLLYSDGNLVDLLVKSNICRYAEFRAIDHVCTIIDNEIKSVPCSRTDVFNTKDLTIVEKRLLMKLLKNCMDFSETSNELNVHENKTFLEYLKENNLTDNIIHCVLYAISMGNENTTIKDGIEKTKKFLKSLGKYGNSPFLFPMYGCGEIPQCFCRLCAVFGGIYCLKKNIDEINYSNDENRSKILGIRIGLQNIETKNIVFGNSYIPKSLFERREIQNSKETKCGDLARAIFITSTPLGDDEDDLNSGGGGVNFLRLPSEVSSHGAFVIQLSHYSGTCPKNLYIIQITCKSISDNPENDLKIYTDKLLNKSYSPKILYQAYFKITNCKNCSFNCKKLPDNCQIACGPYFEIDYDLSILNGKEIFDSLYKNELFLPRAPDAEEIIIGDEITSDDGTEEIVAELKEVELAKNFINEFFEEDMSQ